MPPYTQVLSALRKNYLIWLCTEFRLSSEGPVVNLRNRLKDTFTETRFIVTPGIMPFSRDIADRINHVNHLLLLNLLHLHHALLLHQHLTALVRLPSLMRRGTALGVMTQTMTSTYRTHTSSILHLFLFNMNNNLISFPLILFSNTPTITMFHLHQIHLSILSMLLFPQQHTRSTVVSIHTYLRSLAFTWPCFSLIGPYITFFWTL